MKKKWIKDLEEHECVHLQDGKEAKMLIEIRPDLESLIKNATNIARVVIYPNTVIGGNPHPMWGILHDAGLSEATIYAINDLLDFQELNTEPIEKLMGETTEKLKKLLSTRPSLDYDEVNRLRDEHAEMKEVIKELIKEFNSYKSLAQGTSKCGAILKAEELMDKINTTK